MEIFRGAFILSPKFKEVEKEREKRCYNLQEVTIKAMVKEGSLTPLLIAKLGIFYELLLDAISTACLCWSKKWSSDAYEEWLTKTLMNQLL